MIEYSLSIFIFRTKSLSLNSQCQARFVQAEPHLSISDFLSTYLVHLERKVHAQGLTKSFGAQYRLEDLGAFQHISVSLDCSLN